MFRKILTTITAITMAASLFSRCVAKPETEQTPTTETTVQTEETTITEATTTEAPVEEVSTTTETSVIETSISEITTEITTTETVVTQAPASRIKVIEQANKIASDFMNELKTNVQNVDYTAFEAMYDRSNPAITDEVIKNDWDFFNQYFTGEKIYDIDCKVTAFDDNQIIFDTFLHWGMTNSSQTNWSSKKVEHFNRYIIYDAKSNKWLWGATEKLDDNLLKQREAYFINSYGKDAYYNGICYNDYQAKHYVALEKGFSVNVKSAVLRDDGSLDLVISITNGLDVSKNIKSISGNISFGKDQNNLKEVVELSRGYIYYDYDFIGTVPAKTVKIIKITVPKEKLVNPVTEKSELNYINQKFDCKH